MHMNLAKEQLPPLAEIGIRQFQPGDAAAFRRLNEEWITRFFRIEPKEELILADPQGTILDMGGRIFFATAGERCVGCCALIRLGTKNLRWPRWLSSRRTREPASVAGYFMQRSRRGEMRAHKDSIWRPTTC